MLYQDTTMGDMIEDPEGIKIELKTMANVIFRNILAEAPYVEKQFYIPNHYNETIELLVDLQLPSDTYYQNIQLLIKFIPRGVQKIDVRPIIRLLHQVFMRQFSPIRNPLTLEGIIWVIRECMISIYKRNDGRLIAQTVDLNFAAALAKLVYKDSLFFDYALDILSLLAAHNKVLDLFRRTKFHHTILDLLMTKLNIKDTSLLACFTIVMYTLEHGFGVDDLGTLQSFVEAFHLQVDDRNTKLPAIQDCWLLMAQAKQSREIMRVIEVEKAHAHLKVIEPIREDGSKRLLSESIKDPRLRKHDAAASSHPSVVRAMPPDCSQIDQSIEKVLQEAKHYNYREEEAAAGLSMPPRQVFVGLLPLPKEKPVGKTKIIEVEIDDEEKAIKDIIDEESAMVYLRALYVNCMVDDIVGERMKKAGIEDDGRLVETEEEIQRRLEKSKEPPLTSNDAVIHYIHQKKPAEHPTPQQSRRPAEGPFGYDSAFINLDMITRNDGDSQSYKGIRRTAAPSVEKKGAGSAHGKHGLGKTHYDFSNQDYSSQYDKPSKVNVYISSKRRSQRPPTSGAEKVESFDNVGRSLADAGDLQ